MTNLQFIVGANSLSTPLIEKEEPSWKHEANGYTSYIGIQCIHKSHSMPVGDFILVPVPVYIDAEA